VNKESRLIFEKYSARRVDEGLADEAKTSDNGSVKGLSQQAASVIKGTVPGPKGDISKVENYSATASTKLNKTAQEIIADINKLGVDVRKLSPKSIDTFTVNLNDAFGKLIEELRQPAAQNPVTQPKSNVASSTGTTALPKK